MKKTIQFLFALLVVQIALALGLHFGTKDTLAVVPPSEPLLKADTAQIDRIAIDGTDPTGYTGSIELKKDGDKWKLATDGNAGTDADPAKVTQMLDKLARIQLGTPVATSEGAPERFQVGDKGYVRRLVLESAGKPVATIYFGKLIGIRQMHVRRSDQKVVYAGNFTVFDAPLKSVDWLPSGLPAGAPPAAAAAPANVPMPQ